jgi:hypothetical protein
VPFARLNHDAITTLLNIGNASLFRMFPFVTNFWRAQ